MADRTVFFIVADERSNAGERDYMKAIAAVIANSAPTKTTFCALKVGSDEGFPKSCHHVAPVDDKTYARIAHVQSAYFEQVEGDVVLIGVGSSTLDTLLDAKTVLQKNSKANLEEAAYITHMIAPEDEAALVAADIQVFAPLVTDAPYRLHSLDSVPHTNSLLSCSLDYDHFKKDDKHAAMRSMIDSGAPFIFVVLNAGFEDKVDKSVWYKYTEDEAYAHGNALGSYLAAETNLIVVDGGPRNRTEEKIHKQENMANFCAGYAGAQWELGADASIFRDEFEFGQPYNMIKVGYILSRLPNCQGFISNAEGFGTMGALLLHGNNQSKIMGMFPFAAQAQEPTGTHLKNIASFHQKGIAILGADEGGLVVDHQHDEQNIPVQEKDAALEIARVLNIANYDSAPKLKTGFNPCP